MTQTREALVKRALNKLGVIGAGQVASAEDATAVDDTVDPVMADLATRDIYAWGDPDQIENDAFEHLADCLAVANATDYGKSEFDGVTPEQKRLMAEGRLRQLNLIFLSGQPLAVDYY